MSEKYSPENVKVFIGGKEVTGWQDISYSEQGKPLKETEFPVECELSEEDIQNNSEVGE